MPKQLSNLYDLFLTKIKSLYDTENRLVKALAKLEKQADDSKLKDAFRTHLKETKGHVERLEKIFRMLDAKPQAAKVEGIRGIIKDGEWVIKNVQPEEALDANLIAAAQYAEHYEMAGYGSAKEWALLLGEAEAADLLSQTLEEEKAADEKLNTLAQSGINERALELT
jgi:ferritin-like metal-binding protein YciE